MGNLWLVLFTFIGLIPKKAKAENRVPLISLVGCIYKLLSEVFGL